MKAVFLLALFTNVGHALRWPIGKSTQSPRAIDSSEPAQELLSKLHESNDAQKQMQRSLAAAAAPPGDHSDCFAKALKQVDTCTELGDLTNERKRMALASQLVVCELLQASLSVPEECNLESLKALLCVE